MTRRRISIALLLASVSSAGATQALASSAPRWSLEQLASFADVVVVGDVAELAPGWDPESSRIYTFVTLDVSRVLKGAVPGSRIVVKQLGGRVGELGLHVPDQADFHVGERVLLFLEVRPRDGTLYTSALWQGKWTLDADARGGALVERQAPAHEWLAPMERQRMRDVERAVARAPRSRAGAPYIAYGGGTSTSAAPMEFTASSTHAFTLLGPLRYLFSPIVDVQRGGQPGLPGGGFREILAAIARWNNAGSQFRFGIGAAEIGPRCTTQELENGRVTISFMDPCDEMSDTGGTLAIGGSYYFFGGAGIINGQEFHRASEGFIVLNDGATALEYLTRPGCFEDVQTHELGHVLGLGHSLDPNAIMFPTVDAGCVNGPRELGADDIAGLTFIYGARTTGGTLAPMTAPDEVFVQVNGRTSVTVSWSPVNAVAAADPAAAAGYRVEFRRGHQDGGPVFASMTTSMTTLTAAIPPGVHGAFNVVVVPVNANGAGPSSPRRDFTICGAPPPAVPALVGGVAGGVARVMWEPSAEATSYQIAAGTMPGVADLIAPTDVGTATGIEAAVPPGFAAWVRVAAVNACGASTAKEVLVH